MKDDETRSVVSMQELEPSPVTDDWDDLEQGEDFQDAVESQRADQAGRGFFGQALGLGGGIRAGLRSGRWDSWCMLTASPENSRFEDSSRNKKLIE